MVGGEVLCDFDFAFELLALGDGDLLQDLEVEEVTVALGGAGDDQKEWLFLADLVVVVVSEQAVGWLKETGMDAWVEFAEFPEVAQAGGGFL